VKRLERCFNCKAMVTTDPHETDFLIVHAQDGQATCYEHLFPVFLCSAQCLEAHKREHEAGGVVK